MLPEGHQVFLKDRDQHGYVKQQVHPRSYVISTPSGDYRRNRSMINKLPESQMSFRKTQITPATTADVQQPIVEQPTSTVAPPQSLPSPDRDKAVKPVQPRTNSVVPQSEVKTSRYGRPIIKPTRYQVP